MNQYLCTHQYTEESGFDVYIDVYINIDIYINIQRISMYRCTRRILTPLYIDVYIDIDSYINIDVYIESRLLYILMYTFILMYTSIFMHTLKLDSPEVAANILVYRVYALGVQCVAVCCSELQCVAVCCSVLQCVAVCCLSTCCISFMFQGLGFRV